MMIAGVTSGISTQFTGSANVCTNKEAGVSFDSLLAGMIKGKEPLSPGMQEESSVSPELKDQEESGDQETMEPAYPDFFPFRPIQEGQTSAFGRNVPTDDQADPAGTWQVSMTEKQLMLTDRLEKPEAEAAPALLATPTAPAALIEPAAQAPAQPEATEYSPQLEYATTAETVTTDAPTASKPQAGERISAPESMELRVTGKKERAFTGLESSSPEESLKDLPARTATVATEPTREPAEAPARMQTSASSTVEEDTVDQPEASVKTSVSIDSKAPLNQGPVIRDLTGESAFGKTPSKVTASHIEAIQKTIEIQIAKTPALGNTVVKILLTPDNIGDIHVQLVKTKDSITAVLQVNDAETKGLLDEQLPQLMEPFKHGFSEAPVTITVVADASLGFSFSEGSDQNYRKMERQEARKRAEKEKPTAKEKPMKKKSLSGISLLA